MANTNKIKLKRSAIAGKIPKIADVDLGELAMNTADGKLFMKKDDGTESIVEIGNPGGTDNQVQFNDGGSFGGNASLTFDKNTKTLSVGEAPGMSIRTTIDDKSPSASISLYNGQIGSSSIIFNSDSAYHPNAISMMGIGGVAIGEGQGNSLVVGSPGISAPQQTINMIDALDNALVTKEWVHASRVLPTIDMGTIDKLTPPVLNPITGEYYTASEDGDYPSFDPPAGGLMNIKTGDILLWDGNEWRISLSKKLIDAIALKKFSDFIDNTKHGYKLDNNKKIFTGKDSVNLTKTEDGKQDNMVYVDGVKYTGYKTTDLPFKSEAGTILYDIDRKAPVYHDGTDWMPISGSGSNPGGINKQVQFNDDGSFEGSASLTFDSSTKTLSVGEAPGMSFRTIIGADKASLSMYNNATISSNINFNIDDSISISAPHDITIVSIGDSISVLTVGSLGISAHTHTLSVGDKDKLSFRTIIDDETASLMLYDGPTDSSFITFNSDSAQHSNAISMMGIGGVAIGEGQGNSLVIGSPGISAPQQTINMIDALDNALVTKEWVQANTAVAQKKPTAPKDLSLTPTYDEFQGILDYAKLISDRLEKAGIFVKMK